MSGPEHEESGRVASRVEDAVEGAQTATALGRSVKIRHGVSSVGEPSRGLRGDPSIRRTMTVGASDDAEEHQADATAHSVVRWLANRAGTATEVGADPASRIQSAPPPWAGVDVRLVFADGTAKSFETPGMDKSIRAFAAAFA